MKLINSISFVKNKEKNIFLSILNNKGTNSYKIVTPYIKVDLIDKKDFNKFLYIGTSDRYYEIIAPEFIISSINNFINGKYSNLRPVNKDLEGKIKVIEVNGNNRILIKYNDFIKKISYYNDFILTNRFYYYSYFDNIEFAKYEHLNIGYFDIEIIPNDNKFPNPDIASFPVALVSLYIQGRCNEIWVLINKEIFSNFNNGIGKYKYIYEIDEFKFISEKYKNINDIRIYTIEVDNENELLKEFTNICMNKVNVLSGWNSVSFDFKYLYNRAKKINNNYFIDYFFPDLLNEYTIEKEMRLKEDQDTLFWKNTDVETFEFNVLRTPNLDYNTLMKTALVNKKYPSYKLGYIASEILGSKITKIDINIRRAMEHKELFIKYNMMDSILVSLIEEKINLIRFLFNIRDIVGFFPLNRINSNVILQTYLSKIFLNNKESKIFLDTSKKDTLNNELYKIYKVVNNEK